MQSVSLRFRSWPKYPLQAVSLMSACFKEIQKRFMISMPKFLVKIVDKNGTRVIDVPF